MASIWDNMGKSSSAVKSGSAMTNPMKVTVGGNPDDQLSSIADSQYSYYQNQYVPFQNSLIAQSRSRSPSLLGEQSTYTDTANNNLEGINARALARYGTARSDRQKSAAGRMNALSQAAAASKSANDMALSERDMNTAMLGQMAALGRGLSTQSLDGLSGAAANERSRQMQEAQADAAADQARQAQQAQMAASMMSLIGMFALASDERLKYDIQPIEGALEKLQQLQGFTWNWIDTDEADAGVIAQQVEEVMPELVEEREDGYKAVKYQGLIGLLISAMNELVGKLPADLLDEQETE